MKKFTETIFTLLLFISLVSAWTATPVGIGYFLYNWANEVAVGAAMWAGFKLWAKMLVGGFIGAVVGYLGSGK